MLKVQYERTFDDYVEYVLATTSRLRANRVSYHKARYQFLFMFLALAAVLAVGLYLLVGERPELLVFPVSFVVGGVASFIAFPRRYRQRLEAAVRANCAEMGIRDMAFELTLTEDVFIETSDGVRVEVRWDRMRGVKVVGNAVHVRLPGGAVAVIPRDGFEREREYNQVRDFVVRKLRDQDDASLEDE